MYSNLLKRCRVLTLLTLIKLTISKDWNFCFPFSPLEVTPEDVDMLSARNHLDLQDPANEPFF